MSALRIVFLGTPQIAADSLQFLLDQGCQICCVVSKPDRPRGRSGQPVPPPVKKVALAHGIRCLQPNKVSDPQSVAQLSLEPIDLFVVVAYGEIIRPEVLSLAKYGAINLHASLLPAYRGAAPIQRALMDGVKESGVSIIQLEQKMDAGPILGQEKWAVNDTINSHELFDQMNQRGRALLWHVIEQIRHGRVHAEPQDHSLATFAPKILPEQMCIDWNHSAKVCHNRVRGCYPYAHCFATYRGKTMRIQLLETRVVPSPSASVGHLVIEKNSCVASCAQGGLQWIRVKPEGKRVMEIQEFLRGLQFPLTLC